jgi:RND family efflux transporter MFP subunit
VAPIAGIVARRHVLPGEKVAPEQQVLTLVDLRTLELAGSVGTHEVARLSPGMAVQVKVEGVDAPLTGQLARIAPAAEAGTRSIGVTVALANADERLRAGQYALARVDLADDQQRMVLPLPAVGSTGGQAHVWLIDKGTLVRRAVTLGRRDEAGGRVEVLSGLAADAQVLAARFDNLREGAPALVVAAKVPPVASGASALPATTLR